jgi:L-2-amino-thiazoline-4-carboxylic acid hydrolase
LLRLETGNRQPEALRLYERAGYRRIAPYGEYEANGTSIFMEKRMSYIPPATLTHLERRKIEAGVLIPMVEAFQRAIGKERANEIAREVIIELAREDGASWAQQFGDDLSAMEQVAGVWAAGGSLAIKPIGRSQDKLDFDVTRCQYAEFYKELGLPELGYLFHCNRDFAMAEGFSLALGLKRTQTIMEGASHCDFRFVRKR